MRHVGNISDHLCRHSALCARYIKCNRLAHSCQEFHLNRDLSLYLIEFLQISAVFLVFFLTNAKHFSVNFTDKISVGKTLTREYLGKLSHLFPARRAPLVKKTTPYARNVAHVFGGFHSTLYLKGSNSHITKLGNVLGKTEILERQRISLSSTHFVRQAAGLGALTAISASLTYERRKKTLPRMTNAKRAVNEHLCFYLGKSRKGTQILAAHLPRTHHTRKSEPCQLARCGNAMSRHLRGSVKFYRHSLLYQRRAAKIGKNKSIRSRKIRVLGGADKALSFPVVYQRVGGNIYLHTVGMSKSDSASHLIGRKVLCVDPCIERHSAHINGIGSALYRGAKRVKRAGWSQKLRSALCFIVIYFFDSRKSVFHNVIKRP